ncbi:hypothetical protein D3C87_2007220 [compost metagenome]
MLRNNFKLEKHGNLHAEGATALATYRRLALDAINAQREVLEQLREDNKLTVDEYNLFLEEIDWRELSVLPEEDRRIQEI